MEMKAVRRRTTDIAQYTLDHGEMARPQIMHMQAGLLHCVRNVRSCDGQVLQHAGNVLVFAGITDSRAGRRKLGLGVNRCECRLAVQYPIQKVFSVFRMRQEEALVVSLYVDAPMSFTANSDCRRATM